MYSYNFMQWLILFYLYSFIGWVWESCYVSLKRGRWVNRGFLHGPLLPIYGAGAVTILFSTMEVRDSIPLIFLLGMVGATILEYITGACMERMFHVRYWDYSDKKWNLNGHICLAASLVWGCFSVLLTWGIQPLIDPEIMKIPRTVAEFVTILLSVIFTCDFMQSFREAVDLKETLIKLSESSEHIRRMQKRLEVVSAFAEQDREIYQTKLWEKLAGRKELLQNLDEYRRIQRQKLREIEEKLVQIKEAGRQKAEELSSLQESLVKELQSMGTLTNRKYQNSVRQLRRNPGMISEKYGDILKDIRKIMRRNGQKK